MPSAEAAIRDLVARAALPHDRIASQANRDDVVARAMGDERAACPALVGKSTPPDSTITLRKRSPFASPSQQRHSRAGGESTDGDSSRIDLAAHERPLQRPVDEADINLFERPGSPGSGWRRGSRARNAPAPQGRDLGAPPLPAPCSARGVPAGARTLRRHAHESTTIRRDEARTRPARTRPDMGRASSWNGDSAA